MGVPKFFRWLTKLSQFRGTTLPKFVSSLSIDLNSELHTAAAETFGYGGDRRNEDINNKKIQENKRRTLQTLEDLYLDNVIQNLNHIVQKIHPQDTLYLAIDGVPPYAKMVQQRSRRFKGPWNRNPDIPFDSNSISPGTPLMGRIDDRIRKWLNDVGNLPSQVIYSGPNEPGEGEHKIMTAFRSGDIYNKSGVHVVLGMDTDLFMLTLLLHKYNIYLWRPQPGIQLQILSMKQSATVIAKLMDRPLEIAISDFVIITSLLGNDFIPRHPVLEDFQYSITALIELYRKNAPTTGFYGKSIKWKEFLSFVKSIALLEADFLVHNKNSFKYPSPFTILENAYSSEGFSYSSFKSAWYEHVRTNEHIMLNENIDSKLLENMVTSYMETVEFVQTYYRHGDAGININFSYKYHYAPLIADFYNIASKKHVVITKKKVWINNLSHPAEFLHPLHLLSVILPLQSKGHIHKAISYQLENLISDDPQISSLWPLYEPDIDIQGHGQEHTGIVLIPNPPMDVIGMLNLPVERLDFDPYVSTGPLIINTSHVKYPKTPVKQVKRPNITKTPEVLLPDRYEGPESETLPSLDGLFVLHTADDLNVYDPVVDAREHQYIDPSYL